MVALGFPEKKISIKPIIVRYLQGGSQFPTYSMELTWLGEGEHLLGPDVVVVLLLGDGVAGGGLVALHAAPDEVHVDLGEEVRRHGGQHPPRHVGDGLEAHAAQHLTFDHLQVAALDLLAYFAGAAPGLVRGGGRAVHRRRRGAVVGEAPALRDAVGAVVLHRADRRRHQNHDQDESPPQVAREFTHRHRVFHYFYRKKKILLKIGRVSNLSHFYSSYLEISLSLKVHFFDNER